MRISAQSDDPGYAPHLLGHVRCFFGGVERRNVITADEERRLILVFVVDSNGNLALNKDRTEVLTETLYGDVRIEIDGDVSQLLAECKRSDRAWEHLERVVHGRANASG